MRCVCGFNTLILALYYTQTTHSLCSFSFLPTLTLRLPPIPKTLCSTARMLRIFRNVVFHLLLLWFDHLVHVLTQLKLNMNSEHSVSINIYVLFSFSSKYRFLSLVWVCAAVWKTHKYSLALLRAFSIWWTMVSKERKIILTGIFTNWNSTRNERIDLE